MNSNPWNVESLETFLFFCCPECDLKTKDTQEFTKHAFKCHKNAKNSKIFDSFHNSENSYLRKRSLEFNHKSEPKYARIENKENFVPENLFEHKCYVCKTQFESRYSKHGIKDVIFVLFL